MPLRDGLADSRLFWALVELWDADWWGVYAGSHRDLEDLAPQAYGSWRAETELEVAKLPMEVRDEALASAHAEPLVEVELPDELNRLLVRRGTTLHYDGRMMLRGPLTGSNSPPYPAVDALDLRDRLDERGMRPRALRATSRVELIRWLYDIQAAPRGHAPLVLAETGLAWFRPRPLVADTITLVAGEDPWDFALAYARRRPGTTRGRPGPRAARSVPVNIECS